MGPNDGGPIGQGRTEQVLPRRGRQRQAILPGTRREIRLDAPGEQSELVHIVPSFREAHGQMKGFIQIDKE